MKRGGRWDDMLQDIRFMYSPANPFSEEIGEAMGNLTMAGGLLIKHNPIGNCPIYRFGHEVENFYKILTTALPQELLDRLNNLSDAILTELAKY